MALIKCPECGNEISDKSSACIHCGYPMKELEQENIEKINTLGDNFRAEKKYVEALNCYTQTAKMGSTHAQVWMGNIYDRGLGVEVDYKKAIECFLKAAEQNNIDALNNLGVAYADGKGVEIDYAKAEAYYLKAIELGNESAKSNYAIFANNRGVAYADGKGVAKDYAKAEYYYLEAIKYGNQQARNNYDALKKSVAPPQATTASSSQTSGINGKVVGIIAAIILILACWFVGTTNNDGDKSNTRTCAWCNGTGYNGNGAQSPEEYVFMKTPCTHCGGDGKY